MKRSILIGTIRLLSFSLLAVIPVGLAFGQAGKAKQGWQVKWEKTLKAAKKEGQVTVYTSRGGGVFRVEAFRKRYPEIKLVLLSAPSRAVRQRVMAERRAGKYLVDITATGASTNYQVFYIAKILDPIKRVLILPEILDKSLWWQRKHFYVDPEGEYVFVYFGNVGRVASYNTKLLNGDEFKSYRDFLKPRWKGKIIARDIRRPGPGGDSMRYFYNNPELGPDFIRRLFSETDITLTRSNRQGLDWLARGKFPLGLFLGRVAEAKEQGLPVDFLDPHDFKESVPIGISDGSLALMKNAPHPNAASVFINWFLSREGQIAVQEEYARGNAGADSMRVDIPKDVVFKLFRRRQGTKYFFVATPERTNMLAIYKVVNEALAEAQKKK